MSMLRAGAGRRSPRTSPVGISTANCSWSLWDVTVRSSKGRRSDRSPRSTPSAATKAMSSGSGRVLHPEAQRARRVLTKIIPSSPAEVRPLHEPALLLRPGRPRPAGSPGDRRRAIVKWSITVFIGRRRLGRLRLRRSAPMSRPRQAAPAARERVQTGFAFFTRSQIKFPGNASDNPPSSPWPPENRPATSCSTPTRSEAPTPSTSAGSSVPDPFIALGVRGRKIAVVSALEFGRVKRDSDFDTVLSLEECLGEGAKDVAPAPARAAPWSSPSSPGSSGPAHFTVPEDFAAGPLPGAARRWA